MDAKEAGIRRIYEQVMRPSSDKYARTLRRALSQPEARMRLDQALAGRRELRVLDAACGGWAYVPALTRTLGEAFPGKRIILLGADPVVDSITSLERIPRQVAEQEGKARMIMIPMSLFDQEGARMLMESAGGPFDIITSFNYLPIALIRHGSSFQSDLAMKAAMLPPRLQAGLFFSALACALSEEGSVVAVASREYPTMGKTMRESGLEVLRQMGNPPEDNDMTLNSRIIIARSALHYIGHR